MPAFTYTALLVKFCYRFCRFFVVSVNFNLQKTSAEVNSIYILPLILLDCFLAFKHFYSSSTISSTPLSILKITLWPAG